MWRLLSLTLLLTSPALLAAEAPRVHALRIQHVGGVTYFHVTLVAPRDLHFPAFPERVDRDRNFTEARQALGRRLGQLPRLVPQDDQAAAVYYQVPWPLPARDDVNLEFVGQVRGKKAASFLLLYPCRQ